MKWLYIFALMLVCSGCFNTSRVVTPPTAIDFGDSVSKTYAATGRQYLYGTVDLRHDPWDKTGITPIPNNENFYISQFVSAAQNNGFTLTLLSRMTKVLDGQHYNVILFNSGIHDLQLYDSHPRTSLEVYRSRLEEIASLVEMHAKVIIWVDTTVVPQELDGVPNRQVPYNAVAHEVAHKHGFYVLSVPSTDQRPDDVHFYLPGSEAQGKVVAACVLTALAMTETEDCHK